MRLPFPLLPKTTMKRQNLSTTRATLSALNSARNAMGFEARTAPGFDAPTSIIEKPAVASGWVKLDDNFIPAAKAIPGISFGGQFWRHPKPPGRLPSEEFESCRRWRFRHYRAFLSPADMTAGPHLLAMYARPTNFRVINPAEFNFIDDADPSIHMLQSAAFATPAAYPVSDAELRMLDAPSHAVRFVITRKQQSMFAPELIEYEVCRSIAAGLANQADETLLEVLANALDDQAAYTLGAASAKNLAFGDLRALVGTSGTGAAVSQDGVLRVSGIEAELTSAIPGTSLASIQPCRRCDQRRSAHPGAPHDCLWRYGNHGILPNPRPCS